MGCYYDVHINHILDIITIITSYSTVGKIRYLGLSECTPSEIRRAHAVSPLSAIQMEYSLQSRYETVLFASPSHFIYCLFLVYFPPLSFDLLSLPISSLFFSLFLFLLSLYHHHILLFPSSFIPFPHHPSSSLLRSFSSPFSLLFLSLPPPFSINTQRHRSQYNIHRQRTRYWNCCIFPFRERTPIRYFLLPR